MKQKPLKNEVHVVKRVNIGAMPLFIQLGHRGLEKSQPEPVRSNSSEETFQIPKDILKLTLSDQELGASIESIEFTYRSLSEKFPRVIDPVLEMCPLP